MALADLLVHTVGDIPILTGSVGTSVIGATGNEAHIRRPDATVLTRSVTWTDTATGAWSVTCQSGDLNQAGDYFLEVQVGFAAGPQTFALDSRGREVMFRVRNQYA